MQTYGFNLTRTEIGRARVVRLAVRHFIGQYITNYIRERVRARGRGRRGKLRGYSVTPIAVEKSPKPGKKYRPAPVGGIDAGDFMVFKGGYKEYRSKLGKRVDKFTFNLTGAAWKDWRYFRRDSLTSAIEVGFKDPDNQDAALAAVENDRSDMFEFDRRGFARLNKGIVAFLQATYFGTERTTRQAAVQQALSEETSEGILRILEGLVTKTRR